MANVKFDFSGKNFIVTGASSGMGKQITLELAEAGARVLAIARRGDKLKETSQAYPNIAIGIADVCDRTLMENIIKDFVSKHGKIDGLVHAAGIVDITPLKCFDEKVVNSIVDTSLTAAIYLTQICTKVAVSNKGASIVYFSSASGHRPEKGMFAYSYAKAAVQAVSKSFAREVSARKIRINTISPGPVKTDLLMASADYTDLDSLEARTPLGLGSVTDISGVVLFLLSDRASWITGTDVLVDGGLIL